MEAKMESQTFEQPIRIIAFYLPQFYPIPENDRWWGKGFTEWRSCALARPRFEGHYQPHIPSELGFYDLRLSEARRAQAELARIHGVEGFCYWHYWFKGKLLLELPFEEVLKSGEPDFPFCLAWANENWTRRWDGLEQEILQNQDYGGDEDDIAHFEYVFPAFQDHRAIKIDNKPIFLIYRPAKLPDVSRTIALWRSLADKAGLAGIYFIAVINSTKKDKIDWVKKGFDAELIFQPSFELLHDHHKTLKNLDNHFEQIWNKDILIPYNTAWLLMASISEGVKNRNNLFTSVVPSWDNSPRRKEGALVLTNATPEAYGCWLQLEINRVRNRQPDKRILFVNAWNEWAEGNYLEPDLRYGRQYLEITRRVVDMSTKTDNKGMCSSVPDSQLNRSSVLLWSRSGEFSHSQNGLMTFHNPEDKDALIESYRYRTKQLEESLSAFYGSRGGQLLMAYYRLRDKLFPNETIRRVMVTRLLRMVRKNA